MYTSEAGNDTVIKIYLVTLLSKSTCFLVMVDYSKFDDINDSDSEDPSVTVSAKTIQQSERNEEMKTKPVLRSAGLTKKGANGRLQFEHDGKIIYEWEQSLDEVNIYIVPPTGLPANMIDVVISHRHIVIRLKGCPPFIDEDTGGPVKVKESMWTLTDGEININLQKMNKAEAWSSALAGKSGEEVDELTKEDIKKKLMIERFQEEVKIKWPLSHSLKPPSYDTFLFTQHPSFDFSGAEFNGMVPNARDFMGGVKYS